MRRRMVRAAAAIAAAYPLLASPGVRADVAPPEPARPRPARPPVAATPAPARPQIPRLGGKLVCPRLDGSDEALQALLIHTHGPEAPCPRIEKKT